MTKSWVAAAALLSVAGGAWAQGVTVHGVVGGGFTFGGDTIATIRYEDSDFDDAKVHAGGLIALNAGVELRFTPQVSAQALIGYHFDRANASNGSVRFERFPLDLVGHYRVTERIRLGLGARYTNEARVRAGGAAAAVIPNERFKPTWGSIVEVEFFPLQQLGVKVRYVTEKFKSETFPQAPELKGSHGGVYANYYF